ncbi:MAG: hypothetical protein Q9166_005113 [cf. Caloplaca sp. 2 TL-2023]
MSSLPPVVQQAYVCLQCRSQIAATNTVCYGTLGKRPRKPRCRGFSTRSRSLQRVASLEGDYWKDPTLFERVVVPEENNDDAKDDIKLPNDGGEVGGRGSNRLTKSRRLQLYSREALGVTTLGKPAEVLRVRDMLERHKASKWWLFQDQDSKRPSPMEPLTASDILKSVSSERGLVNSAQASQNIEQLRQGWLSSLKDQDLDPTESECYDLGRQLLNGFTTKQLSGYLGELRVPVFRDILDLNGPFKSNSFTRSEWKVGMTPFPGDTSQRLQSLVGERKHQVSTPVHTQAAVSAESRRSGDPYKHILVNKIMRQCWDIKPREELASLGEVDIRVPETHLELLASHKRNILQRLAAEYDTKIDFSKVELIVRLTANRATCVSSLKLLLMALEEITCCDLTLREYDNSQSNVEDYRSLLNDVLLREIERFSSTVVRWSKHGKVGQMLSIYSLRNDTNSFDYARKLIEQSLRPSRGRATGAFWCEQKTASTVLSPVAVLETKSLPLIHRGTDWTRISSTGNEQETRMPKFQPSKAIKAISEHIQAPNTLVKIDKQVSNHPHWSSSLSQESSVVLGRLLYPAKDVNSTKPPGSFVEKLNHRRVLNTDLPGIRKNLEQRGFRMQMKEELQIRMNATNIANVQSDQSTALLDLELCFLIQLQDREVVPQSVRLILRDTQADLLLPHKQMDLRFSTQIYIKATTTQIPQISRFIESSKFDIWGPNSEPETPKNLTIGIPRRFLVTDGDPEDPDDSEVLVDYSFASVERHSVLHARPSQGSGTIHFDLSFSTVDAGPIGGRRQEVRFYDDRDLVHVPNVKAEGDEDQQSNQPLVGGLYECADDFIQGLDKKNRSIKESRGYVFRFKRNQKRINIRRQIVRKQLSDVPMGSMEAERLSMGVGRRVPVRKVAAHDIPLREVVKSRYMRSVRLHRAAVKKPKR